MSDELTTVQVLKDAKHKVNWDSIGDTLIYSKEENEFILYSGNAYFALEKSK